MRWDRRTKKLVALWLALCVAAANGCGREATPPSSGPAVRTRPGLEGKIDIAGGTAHIPVMKEAAKRLMAANPGLRITVAGGGSGVGVKKVGEGLVHIGNTGRPLTDAEIEAHGLQSLAFAIDGVAVAVHRQNPVADLTKAQVKDIFAGKTTNWKAVGGADARIDLYTRDAASGTRSVFWKKLLDKGAVADRANVVPSNGAMKVAVAGDPNAIGYVSIGHVDDTIKAVALDGVAASQENASSGKYPVVRKLYMNTKGERSALVQAFIDFILSAEGAEIILEAGYIPLQAAP